MRRPSSQDFDAIWAYRSNAEVQQWQGRQPIDRGVWTETFGARMESRLVIYLDDRVVGDLVVTIGDAWSQHESSERAAATEADLAWTLDPDHGGRGYATEAVRAVIEFCFAPKSHGGLGLRRITADCLADNVASWRLMERIGMRRERHGVRDCLHREFGWLDGFTYALLAEEWVR